MTLDFSRVTQVIKVDGDTYQIFPLSDNFAVVSKNDTKGKMVAWGSLPAMFPSGKHNVGRWTRSY